MHALGVRRAAESEVAMDRMIAAFATAQSPKGLEAWAGRQSRRYPAADGAKAAVNERALATLGRLFPGSVKVI